MTNHEAHVCRLWDLYAESCELGEEEDGRHYAEELSVCYSIT